MITPKASHAVAGGEDVLACFDATAATTFLWICRLVGSDSDLADDLLVDVYLSLRQVAADGTVTEVDDDWLTSTAFHLADHHDRNHARLHGDLSVRDRALLDLDRGRQHGTQRDRETIARIVGIPVDDVAAALAAAERAAGAATTDTTDTVADMLRRSERWLDDTTRRRARSAIARGERIRIDPQPPGDSRPNRPLELISTSSSPASDRSAAPPSGPEAELRRPRRLMIGAAAGIAAVLALGFVWVTPDDSTERGDDAESTSAPDTSDDERATTSAPSTTESQPTRSTVTFDAPELTLSPGYILGEPLGDLEPVFVWEAAANQWQDQPPDSWRQVWSEPGASRTNGRWFAIAISRWGSFPQVAPAGSVRIAVNGHLGVISTERDGVSSIGVELGAEPAERPIMELIGYGLGLDELQLLAASVEWDETASPAGLTEIEFGPSAAILLQRMTLVESGPITCCDIRSPRAQGDRRSVQYLSGPSDQPTGYLQVSTVDGWTDTLVNKFLEPSSPDPAAPTNPERTLQVGDRTVTVSGGVYSDGTTEITYHSVRWFEAGQTIEIVGSVDLATVLAAVSAARRANGGEWRDLSATQPEQLPDTYESPHYTSVGDAELANGTTLTLGVNLDPAMIQISYKGGQLSGSTIEQPFVEDPLRPVHELVTAQATVLVIALREPAAGTAVRVTVAGREPVVIPLTPVGDSGLLVAFDAFSELPPYTVELVDDAGTTVQQLSP